MKNELNAPQSQNASTEARTEKAADTVNVLMVSKRPHILAHRQARWARRTAHA